MTNAAKPALSIVIRHLSSGRLFLPGANFKRRFSVADLVALPVLDDQLHLISARREVFGQRQPELNVKVASPAAAAICFPSGLTANPSAPGHASTC